ncbi:hypothetical protein QTP70_026366 [Hemibagrus guttatus]|uniref:Uncharacterized protein n=1 Tax=Hemibagrus guttatus TaxID=175788 RepID=A0AAE0V7M9_9TELE|nr:hypothetical protein QTP70_026366 [Hemibagrus guttatus]
MSEDTASQHVVETGEKGVVEGVQAEEKEARGTKRKMENLEEGEVSEQNIFKFKKTTVNSIKLYYSISQLDDEAMASMLADFVDCPPDDKDHGASHSHS